MPLGHSWCAAERLTWLSLKTSRRLVTFWKVRLCCRGGRAREPEPSSFESHEEQMAAGPTSRLQARSPSWDALCLNDASSHFVGIASVATRPLALYSYNRPSSMSRLPLGLEPLMTANVVLEGRHHTILNRIIINKHNLFTEFAPSTVKPCSLFALSHPYHHPILLRPL